MRVENELLTFDLKTLLGQVLETAVEIALHLGVLGFEQADVLVGSLVVIVETPNAALLLIFDHFLPQDLQLQLHKVDLLLQVDDVVISGVNVRVLTKLAWRQLLFLLAAEVHSDGGLVTTTVAEVSSAEVRATFQATATYHTQFKFKSIWLAVAVRFAFRSIYTYWHRLLFYRKSFAFLLLFLVLLKVYKVAWLQSAVLS